MSALLWTVSYRTADEPVDPGPLLTALAELARAEAAVVTVTDSCGEIVLDVAPDDPEPTPGACASCGQEVAPDEIGRAHV